MGISKRTPVSGCVLPGPVLTTNPSVFSTLALPVSRIPPCVSSMAGATLTRMKLFVGTTEPDSTVRPSIFAESCVVVVVVVVVQMEVEVEVEVEVDVEAGAKAEAEATKREHKAAVNFIVLYLVVSNTSCCIVIHCIIHYNSLFQRIVLKFLNEWSRRTIALP
mmetsp:Transcript_8249/g.24383  ORF Transcript_8249/g.24383 Transcript_8249/m.24383 type:complete len:163 (-) Transcript_8249:87-575(-)